MKLVPQMTDGVSWWQSIAGMESIATPALLVDAERVAANVDRMLATVDGQAARLRPHVKTHKMSAVMGLYRDAGIEQFKASRIAEVEMVAQAGGQDCLLALQPVGKTIQQLVELGEAFPSLRLSTIVDNPDSVDQLNDCFAGVQLPIEVLIDVDCGMHRTGVVWGDRLQETRRRIGEAPFVSYRGLHLYDGHLHQPSLASRTADVEQILCELKQDLKSVASPLLVVGGSPTFEIWASRIPKSDPAVTWQCSPGTMVFWDHGYASSFAEMQYDIAAVLITRVISKPGSDRICFDLGHKSVASEMPMEQRVMIPCLPDAKVVAHSEEHLVVESAAAGAMAVGDVVIALPRHICPTVALYPQAHIVQAGKLSGRCWPVDGKNRF